MKIPIFDLTRQYKSIEREINNALLSTARRGYFTLGPEVERFEKEFAGFIGTRFAVGVGSGTDALTLALQALDIGRDDEIIVPANSYPSAFGLSLTGSRLRLVDVDEYGNMDISQLSKVISKRTKAIIPVHLYGNPLDIPAIQKILLSRKAWSKIAIVEDCAQAHGAKIDGRSAGSFGTIGCFSFYPSKNLGAYGDGGMLVTDSATTAKKLRALRMYGETSRYNSVIISRVSRLDELQAALLCVKLKHLTAWNIRRRQIADRYMKGLAGTGDIRFLYHPSKNLRSANHLFAIRTARREELQKFLAKNGIQTAVHYPVPIHLIKSFKHLGYKQGDFPISEALSREVLSLPLFPELKETEQAAVIRQIRIFFKNNQGL